MISLSVEIAHPSAGFTSALKCNVSKQATNYAIRLVRRDCRSLSRP
jgi:hypothetical protein